MIHIVLVSLFFLAAPEVIVFKNGMVVENPLDCQKRDGFLVFTDQLGNRFQIPEALIAFSGPSPAQPQSVHQDALQGKDPCDPRPKKGTTKFSEPRKKPLTITNDTLAAYAGKTGHHTTAVIAETPIDDCTEPHLKRDDENQLAMQKKLNAKYRKKSRDAKQRIERIKDQIRRVEKGLFLTMTVDARDKLKERLVELKHKLDQAQKDLREIRREARIKGAKPRNH